MVKQGKKRGLYIGIAAAVVVVVALVIVLVVNATRPIGLNDAAVKNAVPTFAKGKTIPGFRQVDLPTAVAKTQPYGRYYVNQKNQACTVALNTVFLNEEKKPGAGDEYLTKYYLLDRGSAFAPTSLDVQRQTTVDIATNAGKSLAFASGYSSITPTSAPNPSPSTSKTPKPTNTLPSLTIQSYTAVRAFDKEFANTVNIPNASGTAGTKTEQGQPVLTIQYQCSNGKVSDTDWQNILKSVSVNL